MSLSKRKNLALSSVRKFFPQVEEVEDANEPLEIEVTDIDVKKSKRKNHIECAMAVACKREKHADGVIISLNRAYIIKGKKAVRYSIPESVRREVVSFDRSAIFAAGEYRLIPTDKAHRLGASGDGGKVGGKNKNNQGKRRKPHVTEGIRTVLGSKFVA